MLDKSELWAKLNPFESVESHMLKAGRVCKEILLNSSLKYTVDTLLEFVDTDLDKVEFINCVSYIVAMHDIGKVTPYFQAKDEGMRDRLIKEGLGEPLLKEYTTGSRHEYYSTMYLRDILKNTKRMPKDPVEDLVSILKYHHYKDGKLERIQNRYWGEVVKEIDSDIYAEFHFTPAKFFKVSHKAAFYNLLLGLLVISDWIASNTKTSSIDIRDFQGSLVHKTLLEYGLIDTHADFASITYGDLLGSKLCGLRPLQEWSVEYSKKHSADLMLIEAGTGEGKTSVALYTAFHNMDSGAGFYYALPMEVMVNKKHEEIAAVCSTALGIKQVVLLHKHRELLDGVNEPYVYFDTAVSDGEDCIEVSDFLTQSSKQGLLSKYIVGTVDQVLYAVLNSKFNVLRLLGLLNKTIVLDEIHAYDAYTSTLIFKLLEVCRVYGVKVILMSATLPLKLKEKYISAYLGTAVTLKSSGYPLVTTVENGVVTERLISGSEKHKEIHLIRKNVLNDLEKQALAVKEAYDKGGCIIVYKNTVKDAQCLYKLLVDSGVERIILCHSKYKLIDRRHKEEKVAEYFGLDISNRPKRYVVVATQVLEACLDLDFDICFSDLAPIDILIQRLGRVCRFNLKTDCVSRGTFYLFSADTVDDYGRSAYVYPEIYLQETDSYLSTIDTLKLPEMLRNSIDAVYGVCNYNTANLVYLLKQMQSESINSQLAKNHIIDFSPNKFRLILDDSRASTRLNDNYSILLLDKSQKSVYNINSLSKMNKKEYRELQLNTLSCAIYEVPKDSNYILKGKLGGKYLVYLSDGEHACEKKVYSYSSTYGYKVDKL